MHLTLGAFQLTSRTGFVQVMEFSGAIFDSDIWPLAPIRVLVLDRPCEPAFLLKTLPLWAWG